MLPLLADLQALIDRALQEDLAIGDPTTDGLVPPDLPGRGLQARSIEARKANLRPQ